MPLALALARQQEKVDWFGSNYHSSHIVKMRYFAVNWRSQNRWKATNICWLCIRICMQSIAEKINCQHIRLNSRRNETKAFCIEVHRNSTFTRFMNFGWFNQTKLLFWQTDGAIFVLDHQFHTIFGRNSSINLLKLIWIQYEFVCFDFCLNIQIRNILMAVCGGDLCGCQINFYFSQMRFIFIYLIDRNFSKIKHIVVWPRNVGQYLQFSTISSILIAFGPPLPNTSICLLSIRIEFASFFVSCYLC